MKRVTRPLLELLSEKHDEDARYHGKVRTGGAVGAVAGVGGLIITACWWNPVGWVALCAYAAEALVTIGSGAVAVHEQKERNRALSKKEKVKSGRSISILHRGEALFRLLN